MAPHGVVVLSATAVAVGVRPTLASLTRGVTQRVCSFGRSFLPLIKALVILYPLVSRHALGLD